MQNNKEPIELEKENDPNKIYVDVIGGDPLIREALARKISEAIKDEPFKAVCFTSLDVVEPSEVEKFPSLFDYVKEIRTDLLKETTVTVVSQKLNPSVFLVENDVTAEDLEKRGCVVTKF